jgi:hypothetical protein
MDSQMIGEYEFLLRDNKPVRTEPSSHQCVCLLVHEQVMVPSLEDLYNVAHGTASAEEVLQTRTVQDKCYEEVENPDQAFCDDCEANEHHLDETQMGDARNIHRKGKSV